MVFTRERDGKGMRRREEGERSVARKMTGYMWRVKRRKWEMERQIPSLLELVFRIKLVKIAKRRGLLSLLEMLLVKVVPPQVIKVIIYLKAN